MEHNKLEYLQLLNKRSTNGELNSEDYEQWLKYAGRAKNYLNWCIREHYTYLMENFQNGKIEAFDFCISFQDANNTLMGNVIPILESNLILLTPNEKSLAFVKLLEEIFDDVDDYLFTADDLDQARLRDCDLQKYERELQENEIYLKAAVKESYLKIQRFLKEE